MGQKFRDEAGNIWEMGPDGQPRLVSQGQSNGVVASDPRVPFQLQQERNQAAASQYAPGKAQADATIAQANASNAGVVANAEAAKAQAQARQAEVELAKLQSGKQISADVRKDAINGYQSAQAIRALADDLTLKYNRGPGATKGTEGLLDYLPFTANQQFDNAANAGRGFVKQGLGFTGGEANVASEQAATYGPYLPQSSDRDPSIEDKISRLRGLADLAEKKAIATLGGVPDANGNVTPVATNGEQTDKSAPLTAGPPSADQVGFAQGGTKDVIDPIMKGVGLRAGKMLAAGASEKTVLDFFKKNGANADIPRIREIIQWRGSKEGKAWLRANPGTPVPVDPSFYTKQVPLTPSQQLGNKVGQSDIGAFLINAGQGASGNRLDNLAGALGGDPEAVNTGIQLSRANSPMASFTGDLSGQAMAQFALNRLPGFRGLPNSIPGRIGEDAIYGAYAGQGEGDTAGGVAANVLGGVGGRGLGGLAKVAAKGINPSDSLRYLNDRGFDLTVGQIGRGTDHMLGNAIGGIEDRAAGMPGYDAIINNARLRGLTDFNKQAFKDMGGSGLTGNAGVAEGQSIVNNAYNFLDSANIPVDAKFAGLQAGVKAGLPDLPSFGPEIGKSLDTINMTAKSGALSGRDWQSALRATKANRSSIAGQPFSDGAVGSLNEVENNLLDLAGRQGPPGTAANLANANTTNAKFQTLVSALDNGPTQARDELFTPQRLDDAARAGARNFGGRVNSMRGNRPFYDLTSAGMDVLPNKVPDSGTAGRALMYAPLYGAGLGTVGSGLGVLAADDNTKGAIQGGAAGSGLGLAIPLLLAGAYGKHGQRAIQKALLGERPAVLTKGIKAIENNFLANKVFSKRAAGMFGSAAARDLYLYPELQAQ